MNLNLISPAVLLIGVTLCLASCAARTSSTAGDKETTTAEVRVMSYNIHHANPPLKPEVIDLEAIANVIKAVDPDLVALQEVDVSTKRSGDFNQAGEIAKRLDMHFFFGKAIDYQGGSYGVAILSKYQLTETTVHRLPTEEGTNGEPRIVATGRIELPNGATIRFGSTHLDAQRESSNRRLQGEELIRIAGQESLPFILAGDFNAVPESDVMETIRKEFKPSCAQCPLTSSAQNPVRTIDYILFRDPARKLTAKNHEVINEKLASDHLPVVAEFEVVR